MTGKKNRKKKEKNITHTHTTNSRRTCSIINNKNSLPLIYGSVFKDDEQ